MSSGDLGLEAPHNTDIPNSRSKKTDTPLDERRELQSPLSLHTSSHGTSVLKQQEQREKRVHPKLQTPLPGSESAG